MDNVKNYIKIYTILKKNRIYTYVTIKKIINAKQYNKFHNLKKERKI